MLCYTRSPRRSVSMKLCYLVEGYSHTSAQHGCSRGIVDAFWDGRYVVRRGHDILLECSRCYVAADFLVETDTFVTLETWLAGVTDGVNPFDADSVALLQGRRLGTRSEFGNSPDLMCCSIHPHTKQTESICRTHPFVSAHLTRGYGFWELRPPDSCSSAHKWSVISS